jgi:hypothetical protein
MPTGLGVDELSIALVGKGGVARDDETVTDAGKLGGEVLGNTIFARDSGRM